MTSRERSGGGGRDQRQRRGWTSSTTTSILTTAALAYGAYRLVQYYYNDDEDEAGEAIPSQSRNNGEHQSFMSSLWQTMGRGTQEVNSRNVSNVPHSPHLGPNGSQVLSPQMIRMQLARQRRQRMGRAREEWKKAMEDGFLPTLRHILEERTNVTGLSRRLKELRTTAMTTTTATTTGGSVSSETEQSPQDATPSMEEQELWDLMKVRSFARLIATAYAHTLVFLVLVVQVNLLGGHLFREQQQQNQSSENHRQERLLASYQESHRMVLQHTFDYFFDRGLKALIGTVQRAVGKVMEEWDVFQPEYLEVTPSMLRECLQRIRKELEPQKNMGPLPSSAHDRRSQPRSLMRFLTAPSVRMEEPFESEPTHPKSGDAVRSDPLASSILDETFDILESPVLEDAMHDCLDDTFNLLFLELENSAFTDGSAASLVVIEKLARKVLTTFYTKQDPQAAANIYLESMDTLPSILELADVSFN